MPLMEKKNLLHCWQPKEKNAEQAHAHKLDIWEISKFFNILGMQNFAVEDKDQSCCIDIEGSHNLAPQTKCYQEKSCIDLYFI